MDVVYDHKPLSDQKMTGTYQGYIAAIMDSSLFIEQHNRVNDSATGGKPDVSWLIGVIDDMVDETAVKLEVGSGSDNSLNECAKCEPLCF